MAGKENNGPGYFSFWELGLIFLLAALAVAAGIYGPQYLLPGGTIPGLVYETLKLPGPGAGVLVFGGIPCFFFALGMLLVKKPWTAILMSVFMIAIYLLMAYQVSLHTLDVYLFAAIIIEIVALFSTGKSFWIYLVPGLLAVLSVMVIAQALTGQAMTGESGATATFFPIGYAVTGVLGLFYAVICFCHRPKYMISCGIANLYFIMHAFMFWGDEGFASAIPVLSALPFLLLLAIVSGMVAATAAYCVALVVSRCGYGVKRITNVK